MSELAGALGLFVSFVILGLFMRKIRGWFRDDASDKILAETRIKGKPRTTREAFQDLGDAWSELANAVRKRLGYPSRLPSQDEHDEEGEDEH